MGKWGVRAVYRHKGVSCVWRKFLSLAVYGNGPIKSARFLRVLLRAFPYSAGACQPSRVGREGGWAPPTAPSHVWWTWVVGFSAVEHGRRSRHQRAPSYRKFGGHKWCGFSRWGSQGGVGGTQHTLACLVVDGGRVFRGGSWLDIMAGHREITVQILVVAGGGVFRGGPAGPAGTQGEHYGAL